MHIFQRILYISTTLFGFIISSVTQANGSTREEQEEVYRKAVAQSPLVASMHADGIERHTAQKRQIEQLLGAVRQLDAVHDASFAERLTQALIDDLQVVKQRFEPAIAAIPAADHSFPLASTKLKEGLEAAQRCLPYWSAILRGEMPTGYALDVPTYNVVLGLDDESNVYTSSRARGLVTLLTRAWTLATGKGFENFLPNVFGDNALNQSAIYTNEPLPDSCSFTVDPSFPWVVRWETQTTLVEPYNGFSFGGSHVAHKQLDPHRVYAPFDSSSFVAHYTGLKGVSASTLDLYLFAVSQMPEAKRPFIDQDGAQAAWEELLSGFKQTPSYEAMRANLEWVDVTGPEEIQPGFFLLERGLNADTVQQDLKAGLKGVGGTAGIVLGVAGGGAQQKTLALSANRAIETEVSYGLANWDFVYGAQERQTLSTRTRAVIYFRVKG